jgi:hypothetical protein
MLDYFPCYVNLPHRSDRKEHMIKELERVHIFPNRKQGAYPEEFDRNDPRLQVQWNRTPGSIGCMMSQMNIMEIAKTLHKSAFVMEDDLHFCEDFRQRVNYISEFCESHEWDVFWLGGTVHIPKPQWYTGNNPDLPEEPEGKDGEPTDDPRIIRCYAAFSTYAYIVNYHSIEKILKRLNDVMPLSMGIDWSFIKLGRELNTFMFLPGCVKQIDNISDIGHGITYFSGFEKLGPYWFQEKMEDFDPKTIQW